MRFKRRSRSPLKKKARRGFQGFPLATIAWYGPDDQHASKVAVGIILEWDGDPQALERWFSNDGDHSAGSSGRRRNPAIHPESRSEVRCRHRDHRRLST